MSTPRNIGLIGAHRTGKTTLAQAWANTTDGAYSPLLIDTSATIASNGKSAAEDMPFDDRFDLQLAILDNMAKQYAEAAGDGAFVADRTPLDAVAYLLADVQRRTLTPRQEGFVIDYLCSADRLAREHFGLIVLLRPGIPMVAAAGKATASLIYQRHIDLLCSGLATDFASAVGTMVYPMPRDALALGTRISMLTLAAGPMLSQEHADATA